MSERLPEIQDALLGEGVLDELLTDLVALTEIHEVLLKEAGAQYSEPQSADLSRARAGLLAGTLQGVQIRYSYQGALWCDTLLGVEGGLRLVRIQVSERGR